MRGDGWRVEEELARCDGRACSVYHVENYGSVSTLIHESPHVYIDYSDHWGDREVQALGGDSQPRRLQRESGVEIR